MCLRRLNLLGRIRDRERGGARQVVGGASGEALLVRPLWAGVGQDPGYIHANRVTLRVAAAGLRGQSGIGESGPCNLPDLQPSASFLDPWRALLGTQGVGPGAIPTLGDSHKKRLPLRPMSRGKWQLCPADFY